MSAVLRPDQQQRMCEGKRPHLSETSARVAAAVAMSRRPNPPPARVPLPELLVLAPDQQALEGAGVIDLDLSLKRSALQPDTAAAFLNGVLNALIETRRKTVTVRVQFGYGEPEAFRITYVGPSRPRKAKASRAAPDGGQ